MGQNKVSWQIWSILSYSAKSRRKQTNKQNSFSSIDLNTRFEYQAHQIHLIRFLPKTLLSHFVHPASHPTTCNWELSRSSRYTNISKTPASGTFTLDSLSDKLLSARRRILHYITQDRTYHVTSDTQVCCGFWFSNGELNSARHISAGFQYRQPVDGAFLLHDDVSASLQGFPT